MSKGCAAALLMALSLSLSACSPVVDDAEDPTGWIGSTAWLVEAEVLNQPSGNMDLRIIEVLYQSPTYFYSGKYETPNLAPGTDLPIALDQASTRVGLEGTTIYVAVQAAGSPAELEALKRANDGRRSHAAIMIFDPDWEMIEAGGGHYDKFNEVYRLYTEGDGMARVLALIADASARLSASNDRALEENQMTPEELEASSSWTLPPTPGPLGEWRQSNGYES